MKHVLYRSLTLVAVVTGALVAQEQPSGYHSVACIKVMPGKSAEFSRFVSDNVHKLMQAGADSGRTSAWFLLKSVMPQGRAATCDFYAVTLYPALPLPPLSMETLGAGLKAAGIAMSAEQYVEKRSSLTDLVSLEMWQNRIAVGTLQKGDYLYLNRMKVSELEKWIDTEKKIWQPMAEQWVKDGGMHGWFVNVQGLPGGSELKYQATTVDVFPSWEAAMRYGENIADTFKKVHPGKNMEHTFEYLKLRDLAVQELLSVEDVVLPSK